MSRARRAGARTVADADLSGRGAEPAAVPGSGPSIAVRRPGRAWEAMRPRSPSGRPVRCAPHGTRRPCTAATRAILQFAGTTVDAETSTVYPPLLQSDVRY